MGVRKVNSIYTFYGKHQSRLSYYSGGLMIIDALSVIYRDGIGRRNTGSDVVDINGNPISELYACLKIAMKCMKDHVVPIFVFDGASPESRTTSLERRQNDKHKAQENLNDIHKIINRNELMENTNSNEMEYLNNQMIKMYKRSFRINWKNINQTIKMLRSMGIPVVEAVNEADSQCAAIARYYDDGRTVVLTDDFDAILYGAPKIIRLSTLYSSQIEEFNVDNFISNASKMTQSQYNNPFAMNNFIECCCLMGTDYCNGLGMDFPTIFSIYCANNMSISQVFNSLRKNNSNMIKRINNASDQYQTTLVTDPSKISIDLKKPDIPILTQFFDTFLEKKCSEKIIQFIQINYNLYIDANTKKNNNDCFSGSYSYRYRNASQKYGLDQNMSDIKLVLAS